MSPLQTARTGYRRLIAEEHIVYSVIVILVIATATFYAISTHDHSGNIWIVYGTAIGLSKGASRTSNSRSTDDPV